MKLDGQQREFAMARSRETNMKTSVPMVSQDKIRVLVGGPDPRLGKDASGTNSSPNQARHPDSVVIGLLTFVVFAWAAFAFCLYVIWAKCRG